MQSFGIRILSKARKPVQLCRQIISTLRVDSGYCGKNLKVIPVQVYQTPLSISIEIRLFQISGDFEFPVVVRPSIFENFEEIIISS